MAPFVQNMTDDALELPSLGIAKTKPGDVVEVGELAARALEDHPCWEPHAGPAFTTPDPEPKAAAAPDGAVSDPPAPSPNPPATPAVAVSAATQPPAAVIEGQGN